MQKSNVKIYLLCKAVGEMFLGLLLCIAMAHAGPPDNDKIQKECNELYQGAWNNCKNGGKITECQNKVSVQKMQCVRDKRGY